MQILLPGAPRQAPSRIVVLAGAGVEKSRATSDLLAFAERFEIPVATTLQAKGVFPEDQRLSLYKESSKAWFCAALASTAGGRRWNCLPELRLGVGTGYFAVLRFPACGNY